MAVQLAGEHFRRFVDFAGALHEVAAAAVKFNLFDFAFCRAGWHYRDKRQAQQAGEVGFRYGSRAGRGFNNGGVFVDPAVTQAVEEQRTRQTVFQAAGRMGALIFQIQLNTRKSRKRQTNQMRVGRALIIGVNFANSMFDPGAVHLHFLFIILCLA
ncbi:hypothetical protein HMPREF0880_02330 [Yokenella regensburgei ATCC 43003]|nr:hypothetical protein HMPREF0880_02330 [Yokenella regensburgei ATCC 43003]